MGKKKKYRIGTAVWAELEIDTRPYGNVWFSIKYSDGGEQWVCMGNEKVKEINKQLEEWINKFSR